jgi:hypothetical protein
MEKQDLIIQAILEIASIIADMEVEICPLTEEVTGKILVGNLQHLSDLTVQLSKVADHD